MESDDTPTCNIHTCFRLRNGWVKVIQELSVSPEYLANEYNGVLKVVVLGSSEHENALAERIAEIETKLSMMASSNVFLTSCSEDASNSDNQEAECTAEETSRHTEAMELKKCQLAMAKLRDEMSIRTTELNFIRENCHNHHEQLDTPSTMDEDELLDIPHSPSMDETGDDTIAYESSLPSSAGISASDVITVTHKTFGEIGMMRDYTIKHRDDKLFRKPRIRQFFIGNVLHRSSDELRSNWTEIFVDLVYVGVLAKATALLAYEQSWEEFYKYFLLVTPSIGIWNQFTKYNNQFYHEDLYYKFTTNVIIIAFIMMGNSMAYTFDPSPELNTSAIFLISYACGRLFFLISQTVVIYTFNRKFWPFVATQVSAQCLVLIPYFVLLGFPVNGTPERLSLRASIWTVGAVLDLLLPMLSIAAWAFLGPVTDSPYRVAVNIEHFAERQGALFGISLGVVAVSFLYDTRSTSLQNGAGLMVMAVTIGVNLNHMYYRSEGGTHYKHALRRAWYTGVIWQFTHTPLVMATLSLGAIITAMITVTFNKAEQLESNLKLRADHKNIFFISLAMIYASFLVLKIVHQEAAPSTASASDDRGAHMLLQKQSGKRRRRPRRVRVPNVTQTGKIVLLSGWIVLIVGLGLGLSEEYWTPDRMLGFATGVTLASVVIMEWSVLKRAKKSNQAE
ncbi:hypothetical protein HDU78_003700 [Chytriomyces hyalinus]|nr:hypothetical protein HDU78_003700 [Chytriomyces hyalinus]